MRGGLDEGPEFRGGDGSTVDQERVEPYAVNGSLPVTRHHPLIVGPHQEGAAGEVGHAVRAYAADRYAGGGVRTVTFRAAPARGGVQHPLSDALSDMEPPNRVGRTGAPMIRRPPGRIPYRHVGVPRSGTPNGAPGDAVRPRIDGNGQGPLRTANGIATLEDG